MKISGKIDIIKIKCKFGFHRWVFDSKLNKRYCINCGKKQYYVSRQGWITEKRESRLKAMFKRTKKTS